MTPELKPVEGKVIIRFLDNESDDGESQSTGNDLSNDGPCTCFALVLAAGPKTNVKKGQTVPVSGWARSDPKIDDDTVITDNWSILAVVTAA